MCVWGGWAPASFPSACCIAHRPPCAHSSGRLSTWEGHDHTEGKCHLLVFLLQVLLAWSGGPSSSSMVWQVLEVRSHLPEHRLLGRAAVGSPFLHTPTGTPRGLLVCAQVPSQQGASCTHVSTIHLPTLQRSAAQGDLWGRQLIHRGGDGLPSRCRHRRCWDVFREN